MTNKISGYSAPEPVVPVKSSNNGGTVADKLQNDGPAATKSGTPAGDQVTLTSSARSLQKLEETIASTPVVNAAKVAAVKQQLSSGTYQIDSSRVAGKLLQVDGGLR